MQSMLTDVSVYRANYCLTNSPCWHPRKCIENSMENMLTDVSVYRANYCLTNSPCWHPRKCIENSMENMLTDVRVYRVKLLFNKLSLSAPQEMYRDQYAEYAY